MPIRIDPRRSLFRTAHALTIDRAHAQLDAEHWISGSHGVPHRVCLQTLAARGRIRTPAGPPGNDRDNDRLNPPFSDRRVPVLRFSRTLPETNVRTRP